MTNKEEIKTIKDAIKYINILENEAQTNWETILQLNDEIEKLENKINERLQS